MSTVASRTFISSPQRDSSDTWKAIVELLTQGKNDQAKRELNSVAGIASGIIADQTPKKAPIIVTCDGPRTRIYCLYDDDAIDGSDANEDKLGFNPLEGAWKVSLPCTKEDLDWVQKALKEKGNKITARDFELGIELGESNSTSSSALIVDVKGFLEL